MFGLITIVAVSILLPLAESMQFTLDSTADPYVSIPASMAILYACLLLVSMAFLAFDLQRE